MPIKLPLAISKLTCRTVKSVQSCLGKGSDNVAVKRPTLKKIGVYPAHIIVGGWGNEDFPWVFFLHWHYFMSPPLLPIKQAGDSLEIAKIIKKFSFHGE